MHNPIGNFRTLLKLRVCNSLPFIYNGYHYKVFKKSISSTSANVLNRKQSFILPQESLDSSINVCLGKNCNIYLSNICIVRFKSSKKSSKTQDDEGSDSDSDEAIEEFTDVEIKLPSLNLESLLKRGLKFDNKKVQDYIEEGNVKINREKAYSMNDMINEGDKIDITMESSEETPQILRFEVKEAGRMDTVYKKHKVLFRKYPNLKPEDVDGE